MPRGKRASKFICDGPLPCKAADPLYVARALGLSRYFTGVRCANGHISWRISRTTKCVQCRRDGKKRIRKPAPPRHKYTDDEMRIRNKLKRLRWKATNPEGYRQYRKANRARTKARRRGAAGSYRTSDLQAILKLQKGLCAYFRVCGRRLGRSYHIDHILPIALGGANDRTNIQLTCPSCNCSKHDRHPVDFAQSLGFLV